MELWLRLFAATPPQMPLHKIFSGVSAAIRQPVGRGNKIQQLKVGFTQ
jgi:hypothetical protein